ncbi:hypothetical protein [Amycolatopsis sp. cmx-11-51]|uniref:hypothetical protein n=1 Tax=unclassified Amycolatopsis TaxID=2618356 RepID=UPI0039E2D5CE
MGIEVRKPANWEKISHPVKWIDGGADYQPSTVFPAKLARLADIHTQPIYGNNGGPAKYVRLDDGEVRCIHWPSRMSHHGIGGPGEVTTFGEHSPVKVGRSRFSPGEMFTENIRPSTPLTLKSERRRRSFGWMAQCGHGPRSPDSR